MGDTEDGFCEFVVEGAPHTASRDEAARVAASWMNSLRVRVGEEEAD